MMLVILVAGVQFLILQLFNFVVIKNELARNKRIYYFFLCS